MIFNEEFVSLFWYFILYKCLDSTNIVSTWYESDCQANTIYPHCNMIKYIIILQIFCMYYMVFAKSGGQRYLLSTEEIQKSTCTHQNQCKSGQHCINGTCISNGTCTKDAQCLFGQVCFHGTCSFDHCDKDTQCPFGPCTNGTCSFSNGTCAYDANCMWGQLCINGKCSNGTCTKDDQCNTGNYCNLDTNQCTLRGWVWVIIVIFILLPVGGVCCWLICCCECFYLFCKGLICCCEDAEERCGFARYGFRGYGSGRYERL